MYKVQTKEYCGIQYLEITKVNADGSVLSIPDDPANTDYQAYLKWLEAGNKPEPADK